MILVSVPAWAHDPIFGLGPHVLFKGGVEIAPQYDVDRAGDARLDKLSLQLTYGLTGDWAAGVDIPYVDRSNPTSSASGQGDISVFSKYRFWRKDSLGVQQSVSAFGKIKTDSGENGIGTGTTDGILGLAYGYEGRKWYRWAALRHRFNGENSNGFRRGDKTLIDLAGGVRLKQTGYLEPDTVWLLELNGEFGMRDELNGAELVNTGGSEWFVSPGIFWTLRNFAVKAGVQIPIASSLNENQSKTDYRARLILEWHL
ncbi:MAG: transporter [Gammaproteobacteria bacterium]|nr:transporter [Gammaproteobacteria bacterium]